MKTYEQRVREFEDMGLCTSDAQGAVDAEDLKAWGAVMNTYKLTPQTPQARRTPRAKDKPAPMRQQPLDMPAPRENIDAEDLHP